MIIILATPCLSLSQQHHRRGRAPYGDYYSGPRWGWYGAKKEVRTPNEARKVLRGYFRNENVGIGNIKERKRFFEVDIQDKNNTPVDRVIIDKRTGRIRSIY